MPSTLPLVKTAEFACSARDSSCAEEVLTHLPVLCNGQWHFVARPALINASDMMLEAVEQIAPVGLLWVGVA